ncbi:MAG: hypothetical protein ACOYBC_05630 [Bilifractor sp.]|jgi:hypothetical protein
MAFTEYEEENGTKIRRLENMPFDKMFVLDSGNEELCHSTGFEVCFSDHNPDLPENWWNEYIDRNGDYHYGR